MSVRASPGTVNTEVVIHLRAGIREAESQVGAIQALGRDDITDAVAYLVTRSRRVASCPGRGRCPDQGFHGREAIPGTATLAARSHA
jgi:hypothetical protein